VASQHFESSLNWTALKMARWEVDAIITDTPKRWLDIRSALEGNAIHSHIISSDIVKQTMIQRKPDTAESSFIRRRLFTGHSLFWLIG
jgi:hypothetical protein